MTGVFESRRNHVWREGDIVYKQILPLPDESEGPCHRAAVEADMLERLHSRGVYVPKVISCKADLLTLEYIGGTTLTDYIESCENCSEKISSELIAQPLADWFETFYGALPQGCIRGDVNCRNFLVTPGGDIAGVDFEELCTGERETDLGRLAAYILTYRPEYTSYKKNLTDMLCELFIARFSLDPVLVTQAKERELIDIANRRREV